MVIPERSAARKAECGGAEVLVCGAEEATFLFGGKVGRGADVGERLGYFGDVGFDEGFGA